MDGGEPVESNMPDHFTGLNANRAAPTVAAMVAMIATRATIYPDECNVSSNAMAVPANGL